MKTVTVNDKMQRGYKYELVEPMGENFDSEFKPDLSPKEMLELGVFDGVYMRDCEDEFPADWFEKAKFATGKKDPSLNFFKIHASQPLTEWIRKGWLDKEDPRGWFQWYCRYYMGRRIPKIDAKQIKRHKAFVRHWAQVAQNCRPGDFRCRSRQRQALLHWAYDSRKL
jgi:hypothetical protein